ncbi:unnamed protein product [Alopecurus aequalis]
METDGEGGGGGGKAERRGGSELGRLLEAIGSSEVLEKRIPLIKQLEDELSADDLGLILQGLLASWVDSTCSGVSHCTLHRSILQVALKCSDLDIAGHLGQFFTLGAKASSWCAKHLQCSAKCIDQSQVGQEEEHNRLCQEVNILSLSISAKLLDIAAKCITVLGLAVAEGEEGQGAAQVECVLNKADDLYPTLETVGMTRGAMAPWGPSPQETSRRWCRCTHCSSENTPKWYRGPDGPGTLCSACWYLFKRGRLQHSDPGRPRGRPSNKHRPCMHCGSEKTPRWLRGPDGPDTLCSACGQQFLIGRLSNPRRRRGWPLNKPRLRRGCPSNKPRRCLHCASEKTSRWLRGPDGPGTLCNACGQQFYKGRLLDSKSHRQRGRPSKKRRSSSKEDKAAGTDVAALAEALPCGVDASLDAFFDHTGWEVLCGEAGAERADEEEEELEWLSNKDAFPSVETMAVEVEEEAPDPDVPRARTKGRRGVTANLRAEKETVRRCSHCATEKTPQWREGPEGPRTLCNACGTVFKTKGRLLPRYRPANSPAFSPLLHSNRSRRALEMHRRNVRRCTRCATEKTPHWREGPEGPCTLCNTCGMMFKRKGRLLPEYCPANSPAFSPLLHSNKYSRVLEMHRRNEPSATGEMQVELMDPPENGPTPSPLQHHNSFRCVLEEEISTAGHVAATEASRGEESMEVQPLPERPPVDSPAVSLVSHSRVLKRRRKSEAQTFAAIRATAKAGRADRAAARLAAMDN